MGHFEIAIASTRQAQVGSTAHLIANPRWALFDMTIGSAGCSSLRWRFDEVSPAATQGGVLNGIISVVTIPSDGLTADTPETHQRRFLARQAEPSETAMAAEASVTVKGTDLFRESRALLACNPVADGVPPISLASTQSSNSRGGNGWVKNSNQEKGSLLKYGT